jgi:hypothetical protein
LLIVVAATALAQTGFSRELSEPAAEGPSSARKSFVTSSAGTAIV